jgi:hypothetical protein
MIVTVYPNMTMSIMETKKLNLGMLLSLLASPKLLVSTDGQIAGQSN